MITTLGKTFPRRYDKKVVELGETHLDNMLLLENHKYFIETKKSPQNRGRVYKGTINNAYNREGLGSIPQRNEIILLKSVPANKGFSSQCERFPSISLDKLANPGPGTYHMTNSTDFTSPSVSSKGYGVGFVSKKDRFDDIQEFYSKYLPGPGHCSIKNNLADSVDKSMSYKGLFLDKKGERRIKEKENPGPGAYDYDYTWIKNSDDINFYFRDKVKLRKYVKKAPQNLPGPADYFKTYKDSYIKDGEKESFFFKKSIEKKEDVITKILGNKKPEDSSNRGPGSYIFDNELKKEEPLDTIEVNILLERQEKNERAKKRRYLSMELAKSIISPTDFYEKPSHFDKIATDHVPNSSFVSKSPRFDGKKKREIPGPSFYKPSLIPNNINFNCNENVWK